MVFKTDQQILKSRDDPSPVLIERDGTKPSPNQLTIAEGTSCSWAKAGDPLGPEKLRARIET